MNLYIDVKKLFKPMHTLQIAMIIFFENNITLMQTNKKLLKIVLVLYFFASAIKKKSPNHLFIKIEQKRSNLCFHFLGNLEKQKPEARDHGRLVRVRGEWCIQRQSP